MTTQNDNAQEVLASLSAMFDDEATTQDIDCLLGRDSASLSCQLESFHLIQQTLHKEAAVDVGLGDSLVSRVRSQLDLEAQLDDQLGTVSAQRLSNVVQLPLVEQALAEETKATRPAWYGMFAGVAVAASVAFVIVLGGNVLQAPVMLETNVAQQASPENNAVVTPLADLSKDTLQADNLRLQNYLRQHAEQSAMTVGQGMMPMARVVSYPIKE
ncbi:hypothetical protein [Marinomonas transparens]|uniref:Anti sigma-E protein RseA N-terminal domain-containing protein n=1 Tax=Marinomonas transparens TaxID=2795388 RepID=A0A934N0P2_9GAMM|nr:hypothetical protein [Marinomonas transparens]MBJ7536917.1 hypothetical protein [Marinomonas transparens]